MSEKVFSCGKFYTRDHPHEIISPRVMRFAEIREWLKELSTNPEWGWTEFGGKAALNRSLGLPSGGIRDKLRTAWIWPKEQFRLTARINDIREGYIVPTRVGKCRFEGVYHDPPIPPVVKDKPKVLRMQASIGGLSFVPTDMRPPPKLPNFRRAFEEAIYWNPNEKKPR